MVGSSPRRADAQRNYVRVLDAAFEVFSTLGTSASISDIARKAGVGAGTIYRHFDTKEDLFRAVVADRFSSGVTFGNGLLESESPDTALFGFLEALLGKESENRALADAIIGSDFEVDEAESAFIGVLEALLTRAQAVGSVRADISVMDVKALLAACYSVQSTNPERAGVVVSVLLDGLRKGK